MSETKKRTALFGGSFDPVTDAHKDIVEKLSERFDSVIVMPTAVSPFKTGRQASASGAQRTEMLKKALRGMENVTVSKYEIKRAGVSYTVDTIEHILKKYGDAEIFTVIGSEELPYLNKWHEREKLKKLTTFYVIERNGYPVAKKAEKAIKEGWKVRIAPFGVGDGSSSLVKLERAFGSKKLSVPKAVAKYIEKNALYEDYRYITERYDEFGLKPERVAHTRRVAESAIALAKKYGVSSADALTAALLHDIAKETDESWFARNGIALPKGAKDLPLPVRHAVYGAVIARECFGVTDADITEAIRLHTTGDANMSELAKVVCLADFIEEGREGEWAEKVRLAARESLDKGMKAALKCTLEHLNGKKGDICPLTERAYEFYCADKKTRLAKAKTLSEGQERPALEDNATASETAVNEATEPLGEEAEAEFEAAPPRTEVPEKYRLSKQEAHALAREIGEYLCEKKAGDVLLIDVSERTVVTDYFVIASANSTTQVRSLVDHVDEKLSKGKGLEPLHRDCNSPQWFAVDYGSVIVHVFLKTTREIYSLERIWSDGENEERIGG